MKRLLVLVLALGIGPGCAHGTAAKVAATGPVLHEPNRLIDYYGTPTAVVREYRELTLMTVLGWGRTQDEMIAELKERARAAGADGVILFDELATTQASMNYSDSTCQTDSVQLRGVAIVYLDSPDSDGTDSETTGRQPASQ